MDGVIELSGDHFIGEAGYSASLDLSGKLEEGIISGSATRDVYEATLRGVRHEDG